MATVVLVLGAAATACAASDGEVATDRTDGVAATGAPTSSTAAVATAGAASGTVAAALPAVDVVDLASGATVRLSELPTSGRPMLLWMWAPY